MAEDWINVNPVGAPAAGDSPPGGGTVPPPSPAAPAAAADDWQPATYGAEEIPGNRFGAAFSWRVAVSLADTAEDKLATLRNLQERAGMQPDAQWMTFASQERGGTREVAKHLQEQYEPTEETHLVYTDPESQEAMVLDPRGFNPLDPGEYGGGVLPLGRVLAYGFTAALTYFGSGGPVNPASPLIAHGAGVMGSQAVQYGMEPAVELGMGVDIPESRGAGEQLLTGGLDVGMEAALPLAGGTMGRTTQQAAREPLRRALWKPKGMGRPQVAQDIEQMAIAQGADPRQALAGAAPLVTKSETVQQFFTALRNFPIARDVVKKRVDQTLDVIRGGFGQAQAKAGGVIERETAGRRIQAGWERWAKKRVEQQDRLERHVEQIVGGEAPVEMESTAAFIQQRLGRVSAAPRAGRMAVPKEYRDVMADIESGQGVLPFQTIRDIRSAIGAKGSQGLPLPGHASAGEMDALYGVMTEDLKRVVYAKGGKAKKTWDDAMSNYSKLKTKEKELRTIINKKEPEQAFAAAVAGAKDGPTRLLRLRETLDPDEWDSVVSVKLWEMATTATTTGARGEEVRMFSATQFIRNWRTMPASVKHVLFPGAGRNAELRTQLERLARVTASEEAAQALENVSRTAGTNLALQMVGEGVMAHLMGAELRAASVRVRLMAWANPLNQMRRAKRQARLMTDPDFVRWLADGGMYRSRGATKAGDVMGGLAGLGASRSDLQDDIEGYLEDWQLTMDVAEEVEANEGAAAAGGAEWQPPERTDPGALAY